VGCSAGGIVGTGREEEDAAGFSMLALRLEGAELCALSMPADTEGAEWSQARRWTQDGGTGWIVLGNPANLGEEWLDEWNSVTVGTAIYGGLASGTHRAEDLFVFTEKGLHEHAAAVVVGFRGNVQVSGLVSQGCRPIGEPLTVTKADHHIIHQLASRTAYEQLQSAFRSLPEKLRDMAQGNILVGLAMSEYVEDFHTGDFLVRPILGRDPTNGALAVGAHPRVGQTLQFQLRDRDAADAELRGMLERKHADLGRPPFAALLFTCGGRGQRMFGVPNHDAGLIESVFEALPLAGFFCNGEIGSVGPRAYLHGFTASSAFLVEKPQE
jgi:small ligand-binding sensory domain FIST